MKLRRSALGEPGISRRRRGRGFSYGAPSGARLTDPETLARIKRLVIPPAWRDVWISPDPHGHVQAVGTDDAGRKQYLYHAEWRRRRDEEKHDRVLAMARRLPEWRRQIDADLAGRGLTERRVLAAALRMLDRGIFRTGGEEYAEENGTHGVATLLREHARIRGDACVFEYPAKGGLHRSVCISDEALVGVVRALLRADPGNDRLLVYRTRDGWREIHADAVNERFKELAGNGCTAKDLRTWNATVLAATAFAATGPAQSQRAGKRHEAAVMREVSEALGNTPAVCRASYVDPRIVSAYRDASTIEPALRRAGRLDGEDAREVLERATIRLLSRHS
ncbi:DNA topoisomerase IB [Amycolatopsis jiangsuensis]|uniref:DNA topoisomerase n=1 Tax=Amycolatopsis jiangsuensis TaxID=1181879 RepID=A0A840IP08_9PSEU|nr:DNA topoisomerase IB [Amycolatopsis jiangsuensis]MBB4684181.1 DNA topoisomerase IB [Amycolatopsis jiangsuensis]